MMAKTIAAFDAYRTIAVVTAFIRKRIYLTKFITLPYVSAMLGFITFRFHSGFGSVKIMPLLVRSLCTSFR